MTFVKKLAISMEDILSGRNGRNVPQPVVEELNDGQELAPILHQKIMGKPVQNKSNLVHLRSLRSATPMNVPYLVVTQTGLAGENAV